MSEEKWPQDKLGDAWAIWLAGKREKRFALQKSKNSYEELSICTECESCICTFKCNWHSWIQLCILQNSEQPLHMINVQLTINCCSPASFPHIEWDEIGKYVGQDSFSSDSQALKPLPWKACLVASFLTYQRSRNWHLFQKDFGGGWTHRGRPILLPISGFNSGVIPPPFMDLISCSTGMNWITV